MIVIIDYGLGNLHSVEMAVKEVVYDNVIVSDDPKKLDDASHIILPGVGSFQTGINNLTKNGFRDALDYNVKEKGKLFLGICLGMQLLADTGEEGGKQDGLGYIPGRIAKFSCDSGLKVPHIGWNSTKFKRKSELFAGLGESRDFYYVHSYYYEPKYEDHILATASYGGTVTTALNKGNIFATQFHPEKSQEDGLQVLKNFLGMKD